MAPDPQPHDDAQIVKNEMFDADALSALLIHSGISSEEKLKLKRYRKNRHDGNKVQMVYSYGRSWARLKMGRLSANGLQCFDREVRAALAQKHYWDLDMVNAQPVILTQLCRRNGWSCPILDDYVSLREDKIHELITRLNIQRADAKDMFLATLFGGKVGWAVKDPYLIDLGKEMQMIMKNVCTKHPEILEHAKRLDKKNPEATCLSLVVQDEERKCLLVIDSTLSKNSRYMGVLIHDGGLVERLPNEVSFPSEMIGMCQEAVLEKLDYAIRLAIKPMKTSLQISPKATKYTPSHIVVSDSYAAKVFVELLGLFIIRDIHTGYWLFDNTTGLWSQQENVLKSYLNLYASHLIFYQVGIMSDKVFDYSGKESNIKNMICNIERHLAPTDFLGSFADSGVGKFLFEDGIYDMDTKTFTKGFNPSILFFARIPRKFSERNEALISKVHTLLFQDPYHTDQEEQATWFKRGIARALYGRYQEHKNCYITVGRPNCGRGLLTAALLEAFGDYVTIFSPNSLIFNPRYGSDDAKKLSWAISLANTRLAIGNEITMANGKYIDGNQLKSLSGGGDAIKARLNHKDEATFVIRTTILLQTNDIPDIKPSDEGIMNRVIVNELRKTYCESPDPSNPNEMLQDSSLKVAFQGADYRSAVFHLMADLYHEWKAAGSPTTKPAPLRALTSEWIENTTSISSLLATNYAITKNPEDFVHCRELIEFLKEKGCVESETKIGREIGNLGCPIIVKKIRGKCYKVRSGIKKLQEEEEEVIEG